MSSVDFLPEIAIKEVNAEIYKYGRFQFGIYWDGNMHYIIELQTGVVIGSCSRAESKAPERYLMGKIADLVGHNDFGRWIFGVESGIKKEQEKIDNEIRELQKKRNALNFPINRYI